MLNYQRLIINSEDINGWFLGNFREIPDQGDARLWRYSIPAQKLEVHKLLIDIEKSGYALDYNLVYPNVHIVTSKFKQALGYEPDVDFIPVELVNRPANFTETLYVMYVNHSLDCLDEEHSVFTKWELNNSVRPDLAGQYKSITKYVIDNHRVLGHRIFKIKGHSSTTFIHKSVKEKLVTNSLTGYFLIN